MNRPQLRPIPLSEVRLEPGTVTITMSIGQWDCLLQALYDQGATLLELDDNEKPIRAYRRCDCDLCREAGHPGVPSQENCSHS